MHKIIFALAAIVSIVVSTPSWSCKNTAGTCVNATGTAGEGCKSPGVAAKVCFVDVNTVGCYAIYNSTGKDLFIPTKTVAEFTAFVNNLPAGVTKLSGTVGTNCFPCCSIPGWR
jgi:hypothetical protein